MKKDKHTVPDTQKEHATQDKHDAVDEATVDKADPAADTPEPKSSPDEKNDTPKIKEDIDALALSAIESTEVIASDEEKVEDPDHEIKIIRPVYRTPWWKKRKVLIPSGVLALVVVILAVPMTRYMTLGWIWHKDVTVIVTDSRTGNGVKDARVAIGSSVAETDATGAALVKSVPLGNHDVIVSKAHYKEITNATTIDIFTNTQQTTQLVATGTVVPLTVTNKVSGDAIAGAEIKSGNSILGKANKDGKVDIVLPADKKQLGVTVTAPSFNVFSASVASDSSRLELTPTGSVYFLSKQSGKLDVVKTNIDGTERKIVVPGVGTEDDGATSLIASRDWKYAVLKAKRAVNKEASFYLFTAANDSYTVVDDANVDFTPVGWSDHYFVYKTTRSSEQWRAGSMQLKSFNAETGKTVVLDQNASDPSSTASSATYELPGAAYSIDGRIVYTKSWTMYGMNTLSLDGKQAGIYSVKPDGTDKKTIKSYPLTTTSYIQSRLYRPQNVYFQAASQDTPQKYTYSELAGETYKDTATLTADFSTNYPVYMVSPNGSATLWAEERDGKRSLFVGDKNADNKQELVSKSEYKPYGWLTDTMILLQKNDSELFVTTKEQLKKGNDPIKTSDYHRSAGVLSGYGYGIQ